MRLAAAKPLRALDWLDYVLSHHQSTEPASHETQEGFGLIPHSHVTKLVLTGLAGTLVNQALTSSHALMRVLR